MQNYGAEPACLDHFKITLFQIQSNNIVNWWTKILVNAAHSQIVLIRISLNYDICKKNDA